MPDLQYNAVIPLKDATIFAPIYMTYDTTNKTHTVLVFNDTAHASSAREFERNLDVVVSAAFARRQQYPIIEDYVALHAVICGLITEGWQQYNREVKTVVADMV